MNLDSLMKSNNGEWAGDIATVKNGAYFVQVAKKKDGKVELTEEGLRSFPELGGRVVVKPPVVEPVVEEPVAEEPASESSLDDDLAAALADEPEEVPKKKKHGK